MLHIIVFGFHLFNGLIRNSCNIQIENYIFFEAINLSSIVNILGTIYPMLNDIPFFAIFTPIFFYSKDSTSTSIVAVSRLLSTYSYNTFNEKLFVIIDILYKFSTIMLAIPLKISFLSLLCLYSFCTFSSCSTE